jgi:hypothetical protein
MFGKPQKIVYTFIRDKEKKYGMYEVKLQR